MHAAKIAALFASALVLAAAAHAQVPRGFTPQGADQQRLENNRDLSAAHFESGVSALQAKNFSAAEGIFEDVLRQNRNHADANFLMGVAKMGLEKWDEAKKYLEDLRKTKDAKTKVTALQELGKLAAVQKSLVADALPEIYKALDDKDASVRGAAGTTAGRPAR